MTPPPASTTTPSTRTLEDWYRVAISMACVSAAFIVVVCALLVFNHASREPYNPLEAPEFVELKRGLKADPLNEELQARLQALDLELRQEHFDRLEFSGSGAYLLLAGILAFVLSMKWVFAYRKPLPTPDEPEESDDAPRRVRLALLSVSAVAILLTLTALTAAVAIRNEVTPEALVAGSSDANGKTVVQAPQEDSTRPPTAEEVERNWPRFRGPHGLGVAPAVESPFVVNGETGEGIRWKTEVPLPGQSSPIVWEGRVFLTGADEKRQEVYCFDAASGKLLWREPVALGGPAREPPEVLESTGLAAPTPVTDGHRVYAIFATGDLACLDDSGKRVWGKKLGPFENMYGHASSLLLYEKLLFVLLDEALEDDGKSRLLALDYLSGDVVWEAKRPVQASWATPIVASTSKGPQLITSASPWIIAYEPSSGRELWKADLMAGDVAPSPVASKDLVLVVNVDAELVAIRPDGSGDVTESHLAWAADDGLPDVTSPLCDGSLVYLVTTAGLITCYDLQSGEVVWDHKLKMAFNSSPTLVGTHVVLWSTKGGLLIFEAGREFKEVARGELGEGVNACPAIVGGRMFIRGTKHLFCLGRP